MSLLRSKKAGQAGRAGRSPFVRTKVPLSERICGVGIVCFLVAIGAAVWIKGQHFDPNLYSLRTDALKFTSPQIEGKQGTPETSEQHPFQPASPAASVDDEGGTGAVHSSANSPAPATAKDSNEPMEIAITGLKPMGATEFYNAENLFEKIDGRAPAYLAFNFKELRNRSFAIEGTADSYVDVYEFRMDTPINAFGAFAMERDPKGSRLNFAADGYSGALGFYFRQGPVYVQVIASDQKPKTIEFTRAVAENRAKAIPIDDAGLDGRRKLPSSGLIPESVSFIQDNAQGQDFLKNVFQAVYLFEGKKLPFFIMSTTPQAGAENWSAFQTFCGKFGGKTTLLPDMNGAKVFKAENFGTWKVIYYRCEPHGQQSGSYSKGEIGGVFDAPDAEKAQKFIEQYLKGELE